MTIARILNEKGTDVATVGRTNTVGDVVDMLCERRIGAVLVVDGQGRVVGVLSERDVVRALRNEGGSCLDAPAEAIMTSPVISVAPASTIEDAMSLMTTRRIRHLPVLDPSGALIGIVSIGDLVKRRIEAAELEKDALLHYISAG